MKSNRAQGQIGIDVWVSSGNRECEAVGDWGNGVKSETSGLQI